MINTELPEKGHAKDEMIIDPIFRGLWLCSQASAEMGCWRSQGTEQGRVCVLS